MPAHNIRDNRCRFTHGSTKCPALGTVRVGNDLWCVHHEAWARAGRRDQEEGKRLLQVAIEIARETQEAQDRAGERVRKGDSPVRTRGRRAQNALQALGQMKAMVEAEREQGPRKTVTSETPEQEVWRLWLSFEQEYQARVRVLVEAGTEQSMAEELARAGLFIEAAVWGRL